MHRILPTMERRLRNRGVMNEDRINQLPEALILRILSFLPTKLVIATSVLSKEWRCRWKLVPNLEFDHEDFDSEDHTFSEIVSKSFLSHKAPVLEIFHIKFGTEIDNPVDIGLWVGIAFSRHLRHLVLDFYARRETFTFPSSLCTCNTLETLKLVLSILVDIPSPVLMKSLTTLHLEYVSFKDDASLRNLLSGCPILQDLSVYRGDNSDVEIFTIEVPSLQRLEIHDYNDGQEFWGYLINAPSLKYLRIGDLRCQRFSLNAPKLVEASISEVSSKINEKFLGSLRIFTAVKRLLLDLSPLGVAYPTGTIFHQLVSLEMYTRKAEWWNLITLMLENSPKLQVLKLTDNNINFHKDGMVRGKWNEPKSVPECLLSHLEKFVWTRYHWGREEEKEIATYILRNTRRLKKATFSTNPIESFNKLKERRKMLKELDGVVRASNSCQLVFKFDSSYYESDSS